MNDRSVLVTVPAEDLSAVFDLLDARQAERLGKPGAHPVLASSSKRRTSNDGGAEWSPAEYDKFMDAPQRSYKLIRQFVEVLAERPDQHLTTTDAVSLAGIADTALRAALGKFTTWMRTQTEQTEWPFCWSYDPKTSAEFKYWMTPRQAELWSNARG